MFYQALGILLAAASEHILRYRDLARELAKQSADPERRQELERIAAISERFALAAPEDFREACQLFWYMNVILQYESNASSLSLGRFYQYMWTFYQASLQKGETPSVLKELLENLGIKVNDVVLLRSASSAKFFAGFPAGYTIILGGKNALGHNAETPLSTLCLDAFQSIQLPQPNLGVKLNERMSRSFLLKAAETIRIGTGIPQVFNDEGVIPSLLNRGATLADARDYSVVGCVELSIPGKTYGLHDIAMFNLLKVMEIALKTFRGDPAASYDRICARIDENIRRYVRLMVEGANVCDIGHRDWAPVPLLSSLMTDCLETGRDVTEGGARYNLSGVQGIVGATSWAPPRYSSRSASWIPGYTLNLNNFDRALAFLAPYGLKALHLLPFHQYGASKYGLVGVDCAMTDVSPPEKDDIKPYLRRAEEAGYHVVVGG